VYEISPGFTAEGRDEAELSC